MQDTNISEINLGFLYIGIDLVSLSFNSKDGVDDDAIELSRN